MYCSFSSEGKPLMGNCCCIRSKRPNSWNLYTKSEETALAKRCEKSSSITSNLTQATNGKNSPRSLPAQRSSGDLIYSPHLKAFAYRELVAATRNFSPESLIGEGGFGCVYKGWMDGNTLEATMPGSGVMVAVKKLRPHGFQGHKEWLCELNYLGQLHHPNLVELIGFCLEGDNKLLVYEYMVNGSLENHLFKRYDGTLSWARRIKVAIGAAKGLAFLHELGQPVIYRDFKASNILLDLEFNSKLSDFGLAKAGPTGDRSHVSTQVLGTQGYAAPEYIATGRLTARCDVYSFGVVLLELLSGRPAVDKMKGGGERFLVEWARPFLGDKRKLFRIMDTKLEGQYPPKEAQALAMLALQCLDEVKVRPQMPQVLAVLESISIGNKDHARSSPHHESSTIDSHSTSNSPSLIYGP